jgi:hypothetical protein
MRPLLAVLVCVLCSSVPVDAGCAGDSGYVLDLPDFIGIGEPFTICCSAPPGAQVYLLASLGQGPLTTPYGDLCLDYPFLVIFPFSMPGSGQVCFTPTMGCDKGALGLTIYAQFLALGPNGISNQDSTTIVDNGRCP